MIRLLSLLFLSFWMSSCVIMPSYYKQDEGIQTNNWMELLKVSVITALAWQVASPLK